MHVFIKALAVIVCLLFWLVGLVPTGIYLWVWWTVPKTIAVVILTFLGGGILWGAFQAVFALYVSSWWGTLKENVKARMTQYY